MNGHRLPPPTKPFLCPLPIGMAVYCADCAVCSDGYAAQLGFTCSECLGAASGMVLASFVLVVIVSAAIGVASYVTSADGA